MLREEATKKLREKIKFINREKSLDERLIQMISLREEVYAVINDDLDEIFSEVNLKKRKLNLED